MDVFAVQTYFSTEFLAFFETLLQIRRPVLVGDAILHDFDGGSSVGGGVNVSRDFGSKRGSGSQPHHHQQQQKQRQELGQVDQLRVSPTFVGRAYGELVQAIIPRGAMPLGLYRPSGTKNSILQYAHVNPTVSERLVEGDAVFVLKSLSCQLSGSV